MPSRHFFLLAKTKPPLNGRTPSPPSASVYLHLQGCKAVICKSGIPVTMCVPDTAGAGAGAQRSNGAVAWRGGNNSRLVDRAQISVHCGVVLIIRKWPIALIESLPAPSRASCTQSSRAVQWGAIFDSMGLRCCLPPTRGSATARQSKSSDSRRLLPSRSYRFELFIVVIAPRFKLFIVRTRSRTQQGFNFSSICSTRMQLSILNYIRHLTFF